LLLALLLEPGFEHRDVEDIGIEAPRSARSRASMAAMSDALRAKSKMSILAAMRSGWTLLGMTARPCWTT
jgi:hypothetical protein